MISKAKRRGTVVCTAALAVALMMTAPSTSQAQTAANPLADDTVIDFREEMRLLVQNVSSFARRYNPNFVVLAENGLELVGKINPQDDTQVFPARAYIRSLDGFLEENLIERVDGDPNADEKVKKDPLVIARRERLVADIKTTKMLGLNILDLEYADTAAEIDKTYQTTAQKGFVPFVATSTFMGDLPKYPKQTFNANPKSLSDIASAENFVYIANSQGFGTVDDYVQALSYTNHDVIVTNVFHGRTPLRRIDVHRMKFKNLGSRRLVLAELDISTAATYHYYWQSNWGVGSPPFISIPLLEDPDRHRTLFWDPNWQSVISGGTNSFLYGIIDLGFDGVVLKGVDAWRFFETGGEE